MELFKYVLRFDSAPDGGHDYAGLKRGLLCDEYRVERIEDAQLFDSVSAAKNVRKQYYCEEGEILPLVLHGELMDPGKWGRHVLA